LIESGERDESPDPTSWKGPRSSAERFDFAELFDMNSCDFELTGATSLL